MVELGAETEELLEVDGDRLRNGGRYAGTTGAWDLHARVRETME